LRAKSTMSGVRKMYVVPAEFFDSLMRHTKITEDPLITNQVKIEQERVKILKKRMNPDVKLEKYATLRHNKAIIEEQRKKEGVESEIKPAVTAAKTPKKKERPKKSLQQHQC